MNICEHCTKEFTRSKFDDGRKRFCSVHCQYKGWTKRNIGRAQEIRQKSKLKHRNSRLEYGRKYYQENKDKMRAYTLAWRRRNKERTVQQVLKRRYIARGAGGAHTYQEWVELKRKFNYRCAICKKKKRLTRDHITPLTKGGTSYITNIQPLCASCNSRKFNHL